MRAKLFLAAACAALTGPTRAADYYEGKSIHMIASTLASSAYDTYARVLAPNFATHIPGSPSSM